MGRLLGAGTEIELFHRQAARGPAPVDEIDQRPPRQPDDGNAVVPEILQAFDQAVHPGALFARLTLDTGLGHHERKAIGSVAATQFALQGHRPAVHRDVHGGPVEQGDLPARQLRVVVEPEDVGALGPGPQPLQRNSSTP